MFYNTFTIHNRDYKPDIWDVKEAASATVLALRTMGYHSCLVGGVACRLFGNSRTPEDVDIVVLDETRSQEQLKQGLVSQDSRFYLVDAKSPRAHYKVLWYHLSMHLNRSCKIDLLQPGIMSIPSIDPARIVHIDGMPVMPFSIVLLLKLQAWEDHKVALRNYLYMKQYTDVEDIDRLLPLACSQNLRPRDESYIPNTFISAAENRVRNYAERFPSSAIHWRTLGFDVDVPIPRAPSPQIAATSVPAYSSRPSTSPNRSTYVYEHSTLRYRDQRGPKPAPEHADPRSEPWRARGPAHKHAGPASSPQINAVVSPTEPKFVGSGPARKLQNDSRLVGHIGPVTRPREAAKQTTEPTSSAFRQRRPRTANQRPAPPRMDLAEKLAQVLVLHARPYGSSNAPPARKKNGNVAK
ncbi:hypothetical protein M0805_002566 [Coniferiporia weirii]|nr:hypothetical protein M0805_002566 [Coniferiporia weirii]